MRSPTRKEGSEACVLEKTCDVGDDVECKELLGPGENLAYVLKNEADSDFVHDNKSFQKNK